MLNLVRSLNHLSGSLLSEVKYIFDLHKPETITLYSLRQELHLSFSLSIAVTNENK